MKIMMAVVVLGLTTWSVVAESRMVCLGGAVTETVWALGAGARVVAVDDSSTYPADAAALPKVGYYRMISAEGVLSVRPDLVLASVDAGPEQALEQIERAGVRVVRIPGTSSVSGCIQRILRVGEALGMAADAAALASSVEAELAALPPAPEQRPKVLFVFARGAGTLNIAGHNTAADAIIALSGGINAVDGYEGYRPMTAESVVVAAPEVIVITTSGLESIGGPPGLWALPGLSETPAGRNDRLVAMEDLRLLGFGPRLPGAVKELRAAFHP